MTASSIPNRACIVGAGPGGLALARTFKLLGIEFDIFERHSDVGGIWDTANPGSPMYASAHFISSKTQSHYTDFPMPEDYPDYPSNRQIHSYMQAFARDYGLYDDITFNTEVTETKSEKQGRNVTPSNEEKRHYSRLICVNGTNWHPTLPDWADGPFDGEVRHANGFHHMDEFRGKRVLIVGAGNSGCDIACDAAAAADDAFISLRRGYHFIPKHLMGKPADVFAHEGPHLPMWLTQKVFGLLLRFINGDLTRLGLPAPDHKIFESHPILNTQLLHYLGHGDIKAKGDVERLDGKHVVFKDGSREEIDLVLCATGYEWKIPYVDPAEFTWKAGRPDLYMNLFVKGHANLFSLGFMETNGGAYKLFDNMADLIARAILAERDQPKQAKRFHKRPAAHQPDLSGGVNYVGSDRHATYVNVDAYKKAMADLRKHMGWPDVPDGHYEAVRTTAKAEAA